MRTHALGSRADEITQLNITDYTSTKTSESPVHRTESWNKASWERDQEGGGGE